MRNTKEWNTKEYGEEFAREYNKRCGAFLRRERIKRNISRKDLSAGIMDRAALSGIEEGRMGWRKPEGDILLQRMGVWPESFEVLAPAGQIARWHRREDICLAVLEQPARARGMLGEYRKDYAARGAVEEQFLWKAEAVLMLRRWKDGAAQRPPEELPEMVRRAAACTMPEGWEERIGGLWLAPAELEVVLLEAAVLAAQGQSGRAWELQQEVWKYPERHQWDANVAAFILPQAALLGMELARGKGDERGAFGMGREALELLRRTCCQCHLSALLESLCAIPAQDGEEREYQERAEAFGRIWGEVYEWCGCPKHRLWQGVSMENTREIGTTLKMLRLSEGKPRSKALCDEEGQIVTLRQLEKIENGMHRPSYDNYKRLAGMHGKYGGWAMPMLETDSAEILKHRQEIATLIGFGQWERVEWEIEKFRGKVDARQPRVRQELLFIEALLKWKRENVLEESLEMMLEALRCTIPDMESRDMKWWVFQQEEIMIASNIATIFRRLGRMEESKKWFETVLHSLRQQSPKAGILPKGYEILIEGYDNLLADLGNLEEALAIDEEAVRNYLKGPQIRLLGSVFYRIAWNTYEIASQPEQDYEICHQKWRNAFRISETLADYIYDFRFQSILLARREKFLK